MVNDDAFVHLPVRGRHRKRRNLLLKKYFQKVLSFAPGKNISKNRLRIHFKKPLIHEPFLY